MLDHEEHVLAQNEQLRELIKKSEEDAKKKALEDDQKNKSWFAGKWTFGQTLGFCFGLQFVEVILALALWAKFH